MIKRLYRSTMASQRQSLYLFGSLEVHRTAYSGSTHTIDDKTLVPYLMSNGVRLARLHYESAVTVPQVAGTGLTDALGKTNTAATLHVLLELGDHLGSTGTVLDKVSSELVERTGYLPFGARENDYRPSRWNGFREDYGFTGKEEDVQVGLVYFGKRYLSPQLGRWLSADPLAIHAPGRADFNLYAYVSGTVLKNVDPLGLDAAGDQYADPRYVDQFTSGKFDERTNEIVLNYQGGAEVRLDLAKVDTSRYDPKDADLMSEATRQVENSAVGNEGVYMPANLNNLTAPRLSMLAGRIETWKADAANADILTSLSLQGALAVAPYGGGGLAKSATPFAAAEVTAAQRVSVRAAGQHYRELAWDPAVKRFRWNEADAAVRIERGTGTSLRRSQGAGDFVDEAGAVYDHMQVEKGRWKDISTRLGKKLGNEKVDVIALDLKGAGAERLKEVEGLLSTLTPEQKSRILMVK